MGQAATRAIAACRGHRRLAHALRRGLSAPHRPELLGLAGCGQVTSFPVLVEVTLRPGIADPQGATIERSLPHLGFEGVSDVRVGKCIRFVIDAADEALQGLQAEAIAADGDEAGRRRIDGERGPVCRRTRGIAGVDRAVVADFQARRVASLQTFSPICGGVSKTSSGSPRLFRVG